MKKYIPAAKAEQRGRSGKDAATRSAYVNGQAFRVDPSKATPKRVFLCCRSCGHEVSVVPAGGACPKCGGHSWERYALARKLLPESMQ